jgi:ribulose-5-phosphate 4-epimerase/fuculose-1-phosphate aldolase
MTSEATTVLPSPAAPGTESRLRVELAAVYRLLAHFKMTDLIFTHVSARLPGPDHRMLINPYGLMFDEVTASSLVTITLEGRPVGSSPHGVNPAGFVIHSAVHKARPDVTCVLHTHTLAGCAVAAQADGLLPLNQTALEFTGRIGYHEYEGIALNLDEQARLVADLGAHPAMILRNHGLLTVGRSPLEAFVRMHNLSRACEIQVAAQSAGRPLVTPHPQVCRRTEAQFRGDAQTDMGGDPEEDLALVSAALLRLAGRVSPGYDR